VGRFTEVRQSFSDGVLDSTSDLQVTRRAFVAMTGVTPIVISNTSYAFSDAPQVFNDADTFLFQHGGYSILVDRRWFDDAPHLLVEGSADQYTVKIPKLRLKRTPIEGELELRLLRSEANQWKLSLVLEPLAIVDECSLTDWITSDGIRARASRSLARMMKSFGISIDANSSTFIDSRFEVVVRGKIEGEFWGTRFTANKLVVAARAQPTNGAPIALIGAEASHPDCLISNAQVCRVRYISPSRVSLRWQSDGASHIVAEPEGDEPVSLRLDMAIGAVTDRYLVQLALGSYRYVRSGSSGHVFEGLAGRFCENAGLMLNDDLQLLLIANSDERPFYLEVEDGQTTRLDCALAIQASRLNVRGSFGAFRQLPMATRLTLREDLTFIQAPSHDEHLSANAAILQLVAVDVAPPEPRCGSQSSNFLCETREIPGVGRFRLLSTRVRRPEDLVDLGFDFYNFEIERKAGSVFLRRTKVPGPALVVVEFPPQHIEEAAFPENLGCADAPPAKALPQIIEHRISERSRLVFEIPDLVDAIPLTAQGLLNWQGWQLRVGPKSKHPTQFSAPDWNETAIELPTGLVLQPDSEASWKTSSLPTEGERTVLFHAALEIDPPYGLGKAAIIPTAPITPVWTPDFVQCGTEGPAGSTWYRRVCRMLGLGFPESQQADLADRNTPYQRALYPKFKREIVRLAYDATLCPTPAQAEHLLLSSLGGWARLEGQWPANLARQQAQQNLDRWEQVVTQGRDQKVVIIERFLIFPFGHRVTFVTETVRKIDDTSGKSVAVLRTKKYVQRHQETVSFESFKPVTGGRSHAKQLPFRRITLVDQKSPNLDDPLVTNVSWFPVSPWPKTERGQDVPFSHDQLFWPTRCGQPVNFRFSATDWVGNVQTFHIPVILVADIFDPNGDSKAFVNALVSYYNARKERFTSLDGQLIALAASSEKGKTEVEGLSVGFGGDFNQLPKVTGDACAPFNFGEEELSAPFYPFVTAAKVQIPTLARAASSGGGKGWIALVDPDQANDPAEIFAVKASYADISPLTSANESLGQFQLNFHVEANRSGGVIAPSPQINAISRVHGTYGLSPQQIATKRGTAAPAVAGSALGEADPFSFFLGDASILGGIKLAPLIKSFVPGIGSGVPTLADFLLPGGDVPDVTGFAYDWSTSQLQEWPGGSDGFQFIPGSNVELTVRAGVQVEIIDDPVPIGIIDGVLRDFKLRLVFGGNGVEIPVRTARFVALLGRKPEFDIDIDIEHIKFVGPFLQFVDQLKQWLSALNPDLLGFDVDIRPDGVGIIAPPIDLPDIEVGVVAITGLSINSRCDLKFFGGKPISFQTSFSTKDEQFGVTVYALGGRGYFLVEMDANGITLMEASIEFGAFKDISFAGVARGVVYATGGIFFSSQSTEITARDGGKYRQTIISLVIFMHVGGSVTALGFISVSVDIEVALHVTKRGSQTYAYGSATVSYCIKIGFLKKEFSITYTTTIAGSNSTSDALLAEFRGKAEGQNAVRFNIEKIEPAEFDAYWYAFHGN
jgi:hypothetical protein